MSRTPSIKLVVFGFFSVRSVSHGDMKGSGRMKLWKGWGIGLGLCLSILSGTLPVRAEGSTTQAIASLRESGKHWIEVNLSTQRLVAWDGNTPVYAIVVSTGTDAHPTVTGSFNIQSKYRTARMQGEDYDVPDVPYTMYFDGGYAIHGAYWHHNFGTPVSHGCVNVAVDHARWLFNWASIGTPVVVHY